MIRIDMKGVLWPTLANQQRQRPVGCLKFIALMLQFLDAIQNRLQLRRVAREFETKFLRLHHNVAAARQVADEDGARIAHVRRIDVLVAEASFCTALTCSRPCARRPPSQPTAGAGCAACCNFVHELRKFLQLASDFAGTQVFFNFNATHGMTLVRLQLPVRSP